MLHRCQSSFAQLLGASFLVVSGLLAATSPASALPYVDGVVILHLMPGADPAAVCARWGCELVDSISATNLYAAHVPYDVEDLPAYAEAMEQGDADIITAEPNYIQETPEGSRQLVVIAVGGDFVDYEDQEISARIGIDEAHGVSTGAGITIGVIDSGVDAAHEALQGRVMATGYDFVDHDNTPWETADGIDEDGDGLIDEGFGHGTMVSGILALTAPDAALMPIRVLDDEGYGSAWRVAHGLAYAMNAGVDLVNMSFGTTQRIESLSYLISKAAEQGIVIVAAAGNESREAPSYFPANHPDVVMVTAVDSVDVKADFADWNAKVAVSAPGTGVRSTYPGGGWALANGCSFATPFITGEAALALSHDPLLGTAQVRSRLRSSVTPIYQIPGNQVYFGKLGFGRMYLPFAVDDLLAVSPPGDGASTGVVVRVWPNPTRGAATFRIDGAATGERPSAITIFDVGGRVVRVLPTGPGELRWDGTGMTGRRLPAGVYYVRVGREGRASRLRLLD